MLNFPTSLQNSQANLSPKARLLSLRIIWAALLLGQFFFMIVMGIIFSQPPQNQQQAPDPHMINILVAVNVIMLVTIVPVAAFVRRFMFQRVRVDGIVPAATYATGCIIFWAACEGVSFFGLVIALMHRAFWPSIVVSAIAIGIQMITFPRKSAIIPPDETFKIG